MGGERTGKRSKAHIPQCSQNSLFFPWAVACCPLFTQFVFIWDTFSYIFFYSVFLFLVRCVIHSSSRRLWHGKEKCICIDFISARMDRKHCSNEFRILTKPWFGSAIQIDLAAVKHGWIMSGNLIKRTTTAECRRWSVVANVQISILYSMLHNLSRWIERIFANNIHNIASPSASHHQNQIDTWRRFDSNPYILCFVSIVHHPISAFPTQWSIPPAVTLHSYDFQHEMMVPKSRKL